MKSGKRVSFRIRAAELRLVKQLARDWGLREPQILELAVWAYVLPMAPTLKAPVERPANGGANVRARRADRQARA
jgi:hypothetical protein